METTKTKKETSPEAKKLMDERAQLLKTTKLVADLNLSQNATIAEAEKKVHERLAAISMEMAKLGLK